MSRHWPTVVCRIRGDSCYCISVSLTQSATAPSSSDAGRRRGFDHEQLGVQCSMLRVTDQRGTFIMTLGINTMQSKTSSTFRCCAGHKKTLTAPCSDGLGNKSIQKQKKSTSLRKTGERFDSVECSDPVDHQNTLGTWKTSSVFWTLFVRNASLGFGVNSLL